MLLTSLSYSQSETRLTYKLEEHKVYSGKHTYKSDSNSKNNLDSVVFRKSIELNEAKWFRIVFTEYNLGYNSYVSIKSLSDGDIQYHNTMSLKNWSNKSAAFNGNKLEIKLHIANRCWIILRRK